MDRHIKNIVIQALLEDKDIYAYSSLLDYWAKTEDPKVGFTDMPKEDCVKQKLDSLLAEDLAFLESKIQNNCLPVEIVNEPLFISFFKENAIAQLSKAVISLPVFKFDEFSNNLDCFNNCKPVFSERKNFRENFHYNLVINRDIMRIITSTLILSKKINKEETNDYNFISDATYDIIYSVLESLNKRIEASVNQIQSFNDFVTFNIVRSYNQAYLTNSTKPLNADTLFVLTKFFTTELMYMNCKYVSKVFDEKAPLISTINTFFKQMEN